jgi:hypothetical protein
MQMENTFLSENLINIFYTITIFYIFKVESILMLKIVEIAACHFLMMNATFSWTL